MQGPRKVITGLETHLTEPSQKAPFFRYGEPAPTLRCKTLLDTPPLLRPPNGDVASGLVEGRTPWRKPAGVSVVCRLIYPAQNDSDILERIPLSLFPGK
jgi:hypothetical protein